MSIIPPELDDVFRSSVAQMPRAQAHIIGVQMATEVANHIASGVVGGEQRVLIESETGMTVGPFTIQYHPTERRLVLWLGPDQDPNRDNLIEIVRKDL